MLGEPVDELESHTADEGEVDEGEDEETEDVQDATDVEIGRHGCRRRCR